MKQYDHLKTLFEEGYCNTDNEGRPVYVIKANQMKADDIFKSYSEEDLVKYYIQSYERMVNIILPVCSQNMNRRVDTCNTIVDLKDVPIMKMFGGKLKKFMQISTNITQDYYPELMNKMYIINAGLFFQGVWVLISHG